jgi:fatty-acid desaturase
MRLPAIIERDRTFSQPIVWITTLFMTAFHIGAVAALFVFSWKALLFAVGLWWIAGSLGIGMGYHRLLTHRGYKTSRWMEYVLTVCGSLALEGGSIFWVATHRKHHQNADKDVDPHSRGMAAFGPTWDGSERVRQCATAPRSFCVTSLSFAKIAFMSGLAAGTGCRFRRPI